MAKFSSIASYGAENWTLREVDQKYLERSEMWCWRRMRKITWTDRVRNEVMLQRVKEDRNVLHIINRRKDNYIGHMLCRNCLVKHDIGWKRDGRIGVTERRGRRSKQLLDGFKKKREYFKLKEETVDHTVWRTGFGRGCGPVVRLQNEGGCWSILLLRRWELTNAMDMLTNAMHMRS